MSYDWIEYYKREGLTDVLDSAAGDPIPTMFNWDGWQVILATGFKGETRCTVFHAQHPTSGESTSHWGDTAKDAEVGAWKDLCSLRRVPVTSVTGMSIIESCPSCRHERLRLADSGDAAGHLHCGVCFWWEGGRLFQRHDVSLRQTWPQRVEAMHAQTRQGAYHVTVWVREYDEDEEDALEFDGYGATVHEAESDAYSNYLATLGDDS